VAHRREAAVAEILRVINRSPSDIQPVLDAVARNAARLCDTEDASIFRRDGDQLVIVAHHGPMRQGSIGEFSTSSGARATLCAMQPSKQGFERL